MRTRSFALLFLVALGGLLRAEVRHRPALSQEPAPAQAPAIVLLLAQPRVLDVERFRARLAEVLEVQVAAEPTAKGVWLQGDASAFRGGSDVLRWSLRATEAQPLRDAEMPHLEPEEREALRGHRSRLLISTDPAIGDEALIAAYRLLGGVAAAALGSDVLGIGAAHHGTFDAYDGDEEGLRQDLLGKNPLQALAPRMMSSLVLLLTAPRKLEEGELRKRLGAELKVEFGGPAQAMDSDRYVIVSDDLAAISLGEQMVFVSVWPRHDFTPEELKENFDEPLRAALAKHQSRLHLVTAGMPGDALELERQKLLARCAAALWGEDVIALNWHCDRTMIPATESVPEQLRSADPVAATVGERPVPVVQPENPRAMERAIAEARATWKQGAAHHAAGGELSAKFPFPTRSGGQEHIWITVTKIEGEHVHGTIGNEPQDLEGLKLGSPVRCKLAELSDWLYMKDGDMVGGFTVKVLVEQEKRKKKRG